MWPGLDSKNGTIQDELAYLVSAGLTPMQALETATRNAAKFLGKLEDVGTIQRGRVADLMLLNANPLENIHNTERIAVVISRSRLVRNNPATRP
jgi:imidazolonepropionase-like amidohydrolase